MSFLEAIRLARERGLDLVEVAPMASPPVCRVLDYGRFKYEQARKAREAKKAQKIVEERQVRLRPKIEVHDLEFKLRQIRKLLGEGDRVKITVVFRGRELAHPEMGTKLMQKVLTILKGEAVVDRSSDLEGRFLSTTVSPSPAMAKKVRTVAPQEAKKPGVEGADAQA